MAALSRWCAEALVSGLSLLAFCLIAQPGSSLGAELVPPDGSTLSVSTSYGRLPMSFEPNVGQTDPQVQFLARGRAQMLFLTPQEAVLSLRKPRSNGGLSSAARRSPKQLAKRGPMQFSVLRMQLVGANLHGRVAGMNPMEGTVNYFHGNDPRHWHTNIPTYGKVKYNNVYPGVDLVYYGQQGELEYDFIVSPGGDPNSIRFAWAGAQSLEVDATSGDLLLHLHDGDVRWRKPSIYQEVNGARRNIAGQFVLGPDGQVGFDIPSYDVTAPLIIDPALMYATYLGGSSDEPDGVAGIAVDNSGSAYVTGDTTSSDFPLKNAVIDGTFIGPSDAFVTKLGPAGTNLVWSTYIGGKNNGVGAFLGTFGNAIALDSNNNVYVAGDTDANQGTGNNSFPTTSTAYQTTLSGVVDAFVAKINPGGSNILYCSFLGGAGDAIANGIAVDKAGRMYVTGWTDSTDFPRLNGVATSFRGGGSDAFVTKMNPATNGTASLVYSTFLGGDDQDVGQSIAVDISSNAYVTGFTYSTNFPTSTGAIQTNPPGFFVTAFVTKLNPTLTGAASLIYSTYLGGEDSENFTSPGGIAVDTSSNAYVTGSTTSTNYPVTADAFQPDNPLGGTLVFITKIGPKGTNILYSTYLGGSIDDESGAIAVLNSSNVFVTGYTSSEDFPVSPGAFQGSYGGGASDAFVIKLNPNLGVSAVVYSSFLGGTADDQGNAIAVDTNGNAYVGGQTSTNGFPVTPGAAFTNLAGLSEGFIAKIIPATDVALTMSASPNPVLLGSNVTYTLVVTDAGEKAATSVTITDSLPASLTFVSVSNTVGTCTQIAGIVSCNLGTLNNNGSATITIVGTATSAGLLTNTAQALTTQTDGIPSNNTATAITTAGSAVIITATIPTAFETGPSIGRFQVLRSGTTINQLTVNYLISGTASNGVDYTTLPGSVIIFAGLGSALITVTPVNDSIPECAETVVLTLVSGTGYTVGAPSSDTVTIIDNDLPIVSVAATTPNASEAGPTNGVFTVSRAGCTASNLVVKYTLSGTATPGADYKTNTLTGSVTIAAGSSSTTVTVTPVDDTLSECTETVVLTLATNAAYQVGSSSNDAVNIIDNDPPTVSIAATTPTASETGPTSGAFTVTRNGCLPSPLTVNYSIGGTAGNGVDYGTLTGSVTIPANATTAPITITPIDDTVPECSETVILTLTANAAYTVGSPSSATVTITDNDLPQVSIVATTPTANETGPVSGVFTVSRVGCTTSNLTVNYTLGGTATPGFDYLTNALTGKVTISAGSASATLTVTPIDNATVENDPTVVATIAAGTGYAVSSPSSATVTILDNDQPRITVTATKATVSELGTNSTAFIFTRDSFTSTDLAVSFTIGGSATPGVNYVTLTSPVTIPAGSNSVAVPVTPIDDMVVTCNMSVRVAVTNDAAYHIGSPSNAVTVIVDKELPTVNISATTPTTTEGGASSGAFTVTRDCTNGLLTVNYQISGTASNGVDYLTITNSVAISNFFNSATITVTPIDDLLVECPETVVLTISSNAVYMVGSSSNATVTILDNDYNVIVTATDSTASEPGTDTGTFVISHSGCTTNALTVNYSMSGTASNGVDYVALTKSVVIPAGTNAANVTVTPMDDLLAHCSKTAILTISTNTAYTIGSSTNASVTILDNHLPPVSIVATDPTASVPGPDTGTFVISQFGCTNSALTVNYTISGTASNGVDYVALPGSATIPAGTNSVAITISVLDNSLPGCSKTAVLTLSPSASYAVSSTNSATVTILNNRVPTVNISVLNSTVPERGGSTAAVAISRNGCTLNPLTVNYTLGGSATPGLDYQTNALTGSVTIPAGSTSTNLTIVPIDDLVPECDETVVITLSASANYLVGAPGNGTVTILDSDTQVSVTATVANASETGTVPGLLTFSRVGCTNGALTVNYTVSGTATAGVDYVALPGLVTIPAGSNSVAVTVTPIDNSLPQCPRTVVATVSAGTNYVVASSGNATVTIADNDSAVTIVATSPNASEAGPVTGVFTVTRTGCTTVALTVNYTVSGTATAGVDYVALPGSVTIPVGTNSATITVTPVDNALPQCPRTVVATLSSNANYAVGSPSSGTVTIADNDNAMTVVASDPNASEVGPDPGAFTFSRGGCTVAALTINYTVSGTATAGVDYVALSGSATIPAGSNSVTVTVTPIDNALPQCPRTVVVTISSNANYLVGSPNSATVTIADNDSAVTIAATSPNASENGPTNGVFTASRTGCTTVALTAFYALSGTASNGVDYVTLPGSVTIPTGASSATITVTPIDRQIVGGTKTVVATIVSNVNYAVGSPNNATVTIADNDTAPSLSVASTAFAVVVGDGDGIIDPGETVQETIVLRNSGSIPATAVAAALSTTNAGVTITQAASAYPNVPGNGGTATNTTPFQYRLAKTFPCLSTITFTHVAVTGSLSFTNTFARSVGQQTILFNTNTFASADVPKPVPSATTVYSTNTVSLAATNFLTDVNVSLRMDQTKDVDLVIAIQHPDGTEVILSNNRGGNSSNFGTGTCGAGEVRTVFDDQAATLISAGTAPFLGSFRPDGGLSNLNSKTLNGNWRLRVTNTGNHSSGTLQCWSLQIISTQQVLNCAAFNNPPVASNQTVTVSPNTATNLTLKGSDVDGDPITFRTNSLPAHGMLANFNAATGAITYTPAANYSGPDSFTFLVNDGVTNSASATVSITVGTVLNNPPVASNQTVTVIANTASNLTLKGSDPDGNPITFNTNSLPAHGALSNFNTLTGAITYAPTANYIGADSFTFLVNDGLTNSASATVSITVSNTPPVASNQTVSVTANIAANLTLKGSDPDGNSITFRTNSLPVHGALSNFSSLTGAITYTPTAGYTGPDSFTFLVNDGVTNSAPATVSITVLNNPPVASNQTVSVTANIAANLTLKGSDPDGNSITFRTNSPPFHGTLSNFNTLTGAITYTPTANYSGPDSFTFLVNDGLTNSASATVNITVVGLIDSVGDGIPDSWRVQYFCGGAATNGCGTTTNTQSCAACDPDGDGMSNLQEFLTGTDPTNSASSFHIISIAQESNNLRVTWMTGPGRTNALQQTAGDGAGNYFTNNFADAFIVTNTIDSFTNYLDVGAATNIPSRYYRVRLVP